MRTSQEQVAAYLGWLEERGIRHPVVRPRRPEPRAVALAPARRTQVVFVSDAALTAEERALLDRMVTAMQLGAGDVGVVCALTGPLPEQLPSQDVIAASRLRLQSEVANAAPRVVVSLGGFTTRLVLGDRTHFPEVRGQKRQAALLGEVQIVPTFHPRDLLRYAANKRLAWTDLQVVMDHLGRRARTEGTEGTGG